MKCNQKQVESKLIGWNQTKPNEICLLPNIWVDILIDTEYDYLCLPQTVEL